MYVCLCLGVASGTVQQVIDDGADSTKKVADACGAGSVCGRCRHTVRVMLDAATPEPNKRPVERLRRRWRTA
jgi:bacterioferritin-associated ferredoxin